MTIEERAKLCNVNFNVEDISIFNKESFIEKMKPYKSLNYENIEELFREGCFAYKLNNFFYNRRLDECIYWTAEQRVLFEYQLQLLETYKFIIENGMNLKLEMKPSNVSKGIYQTKEESLLNQTLNNRLEDNNFISN